MALQMGAQGAKKQTKRAKAAPTPGVAETTAAAEATAGAELGKTIESID